MILCYLLVKCFVIEWPFHKHKKDMENSFKGNEWKKSAVEIAFLSL